MCVVVAEMSPTVSVVECAARAELSVIVVIFGVILIHTIMIG